MAARLLGLDCACNHRIGRLSGTDRRQQLQPHHSSFGSRLIRQKAWSEPHLMARLEARQVAHPVQVFGRLLNSMLQIRASNYRGHSSCVLWNSRHPSPQHSLLCWSRRLQELCIAPFASPWLSWWREPRNVGLVFHTHSRSEPWHLILSDACFSRFPLRKEKLMK